MNADSSDIHRLLDEAFAGVAMTPELQDLKEELRGNLAARSAELQAGGKEAASAARTAVAELGDIPELIAGVGGRAGARRRRAPAPGPAEARLRDPSHDLLDRDRAVGHRTGAHLVPRPGQWVQ